MVGAPDDKRPSRGTTIRGGAELARFWDQRYEAGGRMFGEAPNAFIVEHASDLPAGTRALVPGDGYGRNGAWLASRGHHVLSVDISPLGIERAKAFAAEKNVSIETEVADLANWTPQIEAFDLVAVAFVHFPAAQRIRAHAAYCKALAPGGRLLLQSYSRDQLGRNSGGPKALGLLYTVEQLQRDFRGLEIERLEQTLVDLDEGVRHRGEASVIEVIASKPRG